MEAAVMLTFVAAITSLGAYVIGSGRLGLSVQTLGVAANRMAEGIGLTIIFLAVNVALAGCTILAWRAITGHFVSAYVTVDIAWLGLSFLQGLTFQWWRASH